MWAEAKETDESSLRHAVFICEGCHASYHRVGGFNKRIFSEFYRPEVGDRLSAVFIYSETCLVGS